MIDPARQQWEQASSRLDREAGDPIRHRQLWALVEVVVWELRKRLGQRFTLDELVAAHASGDDWAREVVVDSLPAEARVGIADVAVVLDAACHVYARGASDYAP